MTLRPYPPASERAFERSNERAYESFQERRKECRWPRTVLIVEDEPFVREATRSILESAGFEVLPATDADGAIKTYEEFPRPIDLVMTDLVLPGRTGRELAEELHRRSAKVKVLLTSGYSRAEFAADPHPQTYFLAKPYSRRILIAKIEEIFKVRPMGILPLHRAVGQAG